MDLISETENTRLYRATDGTTVQVALPDARLGRNTRWHVVEGNNPGVPLIAILTEPMAEAVHEAMRLEIDRG